jgi:hypothetical protein
MECHALSQKLNFDGKHVIQIHFFFGTHLYVYKEGRKYLSIKEGCLFVCLFVTLKYPKAWCPPPPTTFFVSLENL